jgi:hypothetical protein
MNSNALISTESERTLRDEIAECVLWERLFGTPAGKGERQIGCDDSIKISQLPVRCVMERRGCFPQGDLHYNRFSFQRITEQFPL